MGLRPFPQAFHDSSQFFVGCEDNGIDGKNDSPSVLQDIGGMDVECHHPIQIPVEGESDAETGKGIEPSCAEVGVHLLPGGGGADDRGLRSDQGHPSGFPDDSDKADVVVEHPVGEKAPLEIFTGKGMNESRLPVGGDDGESVSAGKKDTPRRMRCSSPPGANPHKALAGSSQQPASFAQSSRSLS